MRRSKFKKPRGEWAPSFILGSLFAVFAVSGCSFDERHSGSGEARLQEVFSRLASGELVETLSRERMTRSTHSANTPMSDSEIPRMTKAEKILRLKSPCPELVSPKKRAGPQRRKFDIEVEDFIDQLGVCLREVSRSYRNYERAFRYFQRYHVSGPSLSSMTQEELETFLDESELESFLTFHSKKWSSLRNQFSDEDLSELLRLADFRLTAARMADEKIMKVVSEHDETFEHLRSSPRYAGLLALWRSLSSKKAQSRRTMTLSLFKVFHPEMNANLVPRSYPFHLVRPFGSVVLVPEEGEERGISHSPIGEIVRISENFGLSPAIAHRSINRYVHHRNEDNPGIAEGDYVPKKEAVKVAILDTSLNYKKYPNILGQFLSGGAENQLGSYDFADDDSDPWGPSGPGFDHGLAVAGSLLSLAERNSFLLEQRMLDLGFWKVASLRGLLAMTPDGGQFWHNRAAIFEAIAGAVDGRVRRPDIASVSMVFRYWSFFKKHQEENLLNETTWLWSMAAGNLGEDIDQNRGSCFRDFPEKYRPADRILCVGSLANQGLAKKVVAHYSNFGDSVDVYSYETYSGHCVAGTSCAAPAVTFGAAYVKAAYPDLTPDLLKRVIVEASIETVVARAGVDLSDESIYEKVVAGDPEVTMNVRVFDPWDTKHRTLERALRIAKAYSIRPGGRRKGALPKLPF